MSFVDLDNSAPIKVAVPPMGIVVGSRAAGRNGSKSRYIAMAIGAEIARRIGMSGDACTMRVQAGSGDDIGKIAIFCDATKGKFQAKKQRAGYYLLTVNANAIGGRFALDFPRFTLDPVRHVPPASTQQPNMLIVKCSDAMRAVG